MTDALGNRAEASPFKASFGEVATKVSNATGSVWTFALAIAVIAGWAISRPVFGFSDTWQLVANTFTTLVTFLMVFLIQKHPEPRCDGDAAQARRAHPLDRRRPQSVHRRRIGARGAHRARDEGSRGGEGHAGTARRRRRPPGRSAIAQREAAQRGAGRAAVATPRSRLVPLPRRSVSGHMDVCHRARAKDGRRVVARGTTRGSRVPQRPTAGCSTCRGCHRSRTDADRRLSLSRSGAPASHTQSA